MIVMEAAQSRQLSAVRHQEKHAEKNLSDNESMIRMLPQKHKGAADLAAPGGSYELGFTDGYLPKYFALRSVNAFHFSGRSSSAKIADTGHTGTQAPQSIHSTGSMYSISSAAYLSESFLGWMQSTGQASTHAVSLVPMQGSAIT
jgi:hypothetical protein